MDILTHSMPGSFPDGLCSVLAARRNTSLRHLHAPGPDEGSLHCIFAAAGHAPDHAEDRSWRLIMIPAHKRSELGMVFLDALGQREPAPEEHVRKAAYEKAFHAPCLLVAILRGDPVLSNVPPVERLISLGCAIQNMLTAAQALGIASGLASGASLAADGMHRLLGLQPHEQAVCFIGFGTAARRKAPRPRPQPA